MRLSTQIMLLLIVLLQAIAVQRMAPTEAFWPVVCIVACSATLFLMGVRGRSE